MNFRSIMSRRRLLSSMGSSALLAPLAYPLFAESSEASRIDANAPRSAQTYKPNAFLARDFVSSRLELVRLLKEITEVEHSLMLQYLYAGFSLKPAYATLAGFGGPDSNSFIGVAVQEMQHLGSINKLLVKLGASPSLEAQDFPYEVDIYPFAMHLEPLSRLSVAKYAYCEANAEAVDADSPHDQQFLRDLETTLRGERRINHVGSVYAIVIDLLDQLRRVDKKLALDFDYWVPELKRIMHEGEHEHFVFFKSVFMGTHTAFAADRSWWTHGRNSSHYPAYNIVTNPTAYMMAERSIEDETALAMAWLGNLHYWTVLVLLDFYYRTGDNDVRVMAIGHMMTTLRPLATSLCQRGYGMPFDRLSMGYCPSLNATENLSFAMHLQTEAAEIRNRLERHLPSDYPEGIEPGFIKRMQQIVGTWSKQNPVATAKTFTAPRGGSSVFELPEASFETVEAS